MTEKKHRQFIETAVDWKVCTAVVITVITTGLLLLLLILPKKTFSENENRTLKNWPQMTFETIRTGSFMKGLEEYLSDHFPLRDQFMTIRTRTERILGKKEVNGIYFAEKGYLIEAYHTPVHTEKIITQYNKLKKAVNTDADIRLMLVPTAVTVYNALLPEKAPDKGHISQTETIRQIYEAVDIRGIDCLKALSEKAEETEDSLYYRTDHHWTTLGAYQAYKAYCAEVGLQAFPESRYKKTAVTDQFRGTVYSKLNDTTIPGDKIVIYEDPESRLKVMYPDTGLETNTLYAWEYLEKKDKYSMFLNNLHPEIDIENAAAETDRELVLIKDSYANSIVPFLTGHFRKIHVFDTRYYKFGPSSYINEHPEVTDVLILYNMNTIDTDLGIGGIF